ncbi:hypothetical protein V5F49_16775 [Xanthobacter sp. V3C-3]|uniref:hypothetical protein n=1 Tax=Xanthobacter lutulentifluminis TaxID=3119935 RepID=UPI00372A4419
MAADPQVLTTLRRKRSEVEGFIAKLEKQIDTAKRDLSAINATIRIFEVNGEPREFPAYVEIHRLFKRGEMTAICKAALAQEGALDTRELALRVIRAKGLDEGDKALRQTIALRIVQALRLQAKRMAISAIRKRNGVQLWGQLIATQ